MCLSLRSEDELVSSMMMRGGAFLGDASWTVFEQGMLLTRLSEYQMERDICLEYHVEQRCWVQRMLCETSASGWLVFAGVTELDSLLVV